MNNEIDKYFRGELTAEEEADLIRRVSSDDKLQADFAEYQRMDALLSFSDRMVDQKDAKRAYQSFLHNTKKKKIRRSIFRVAGYAAAIAFIIVSVHLYHLYYYVGNSGRTGDISFHVPSGQRITMTLQDGTLVYLNARTRLTYPPVFSGKERRVEVEGEAYFEVAPDNKKPFIVSSGGVEMKVLGTIFNVCNYPWKESIHISLIEGALQVTVPDRDNKPVLLKPNEQMSIRKQNNLSVKEAIPYPDYFLWKDGIYSFYHEPLGDIINKLSLYYDVDIEVEDSSMLEWEYTGKFRQSDGLDEILRLMQRIYFFHIAKEEKENRILLSK